MPATGPTAAYLYVLSLDAPGRAWEYLRRNDARLAGFTVREDIAAGRLVPVVEGLNPKDREAFHAIHIGQGGPLPSRVRALLDFLAERGTVS